MLGLLLSILVIVPVALESVQAFAESRSNAGVHFFCIVLDDFHTTDVGIAHPTTTLITTSATQWKRKYHALQALRRSQIR
jgi:hypothetical protein